MVILKEVKKKPRGKPFKKGNKIGTGRKKMTEAEKIERRLTRTILKADIRRFYGMTREELEQYAKSGNATMFELGIISVMSKAVGKGDEKKSDFLYVQLFGKLKEKQEVQISGEINTKPNYHLKNLSDADLLKLKELALKAES